jgi:hypothetical protein
LTGDAPNNVSMTDDDSSDDLDIAEELERQ